MVYYFPERRLEPMHMEPYRIQISPDSELARRLEEAGANPVILEKNGKRYRLVEEVVDDVWATYDPAQVKAALRDSAGALAGIDREALLRDIHDQREQDSFGRPA